MESCSLTCNVTDRQGRVKVSTLWKELEKYFKKDRTEALVHYFLTKDSNFLSENSDILQFDINGEVTIASLKKALDREGDSGKLSDPVILHQLNAEIKEELRQRKASGKTITYTEALDAVLKFNKSSQFKDGFMATMTKNTTDEKLGSYNVEVVKRNAKEEARLSDLVKDKIVTDALRIMLESKGVSVEFLDDSVQSSVFSSYNDSPIDGLYPLIKVLNGENVAKEVAIAAGHFAVAALKGDPLVERLVNQLSPEVQQKLFRGESELADENFRISNSDAARREAAGILVGRALASSLYQSNKLYRITESVRKLIDRLITKVKRIFGMIPKSAVDKIISKAEDTASTVAEGFLKNDEDVDMNTVLAPENQHAYVSSSKYLGVKIKENVKAYNETVRELKGFVSELRNIVYRGKVDPLNKKLFTNFKKIITENSSTFDAIVNSNVDAFSEQKAIEGMVTLIEAISKVLDTDIRSMLDSIQPANRLNVHSEIVANARNLRSVAVAIKSIGLLYDSMQRKLGILKDQPITLVEDGVAFNETLSQALDRIGKLLVRNDEEYINQKGQRQVVGGLIGLFEMKERQTFTDALIDFYGQDYIERNAGLIWMQQGHKRRLVNSQNLTDVRGQNYNRPQIADLIAYLDEDITFFDAYISSAADCGDFVTGCGNKVVKEANLHADRVALRYWDRIEALRLQMKDVFGNEDWTPLLETMPYAPKYIPGRRYSAGEVVQGSDRKFYRSLTDNNDTDLGDTNNWAQTTVDSRIKTGNFIQPVNWGAYEADLADFKAELKLRFNQRMQDEEREFYKNNKGNPSEIFNPSDEQLAVKYHEFVEPLYQEWHKIHSDLDKTQKKGRRYIPKESLYRNEDWYTLFNSNDPNISIKERTQRRKRLKWFNSVMEMKAEMDTLLPDDATVMRRVPQFTGRFSHKYRNLRQQYGNREAFGRAMRMQSQQWVQIKPEEAWKFGSDNQYNRIEDDPLENEAFFQKDKLDRVPLYGINKLPDMNALSTDIFGSLLRYASMAATYNALSRTIDIFELGRDVLQKREEGYIKEHGKGSRSLPRYIKFVDKDIHGLNSIKPRYDFDRIVYKIVNGLSSIGGKLLLYGNVHGGMVNAGTGQLEILKEALAGENYDFKNLADAHKMYYSDIIGTWLSNITDAQRPDNKNSLWIRHWNILSENRSFLHNQKFDTKALSLLDSRLFEWFDHAMMLPYSSGDHYMQTIPYYAMGYATKVYDANGNEMSLIDAYDIVPGEEVFAIEKQFGEKPLGTTPKKLQIKKGIYKSGDNLIKDRTVRAMLERIDQLFEDTTNPIEEGYDFLGNVFTEEQRRLLAEEDLGNSSTITTMKDLERLKTVLASKSHQLQYNESDESAFMDKCRDICNRLHGIYNSEDKVTFQMTFYGNLALALKGYALGMANRRFADSRFNVPQGKQVEGSSNTWTKAMLSPLFIADRETAAYNMETLVDTLLLSVPGSNLLLFNNKFGSKMQATMNRAGFSDHQYYNIRRFAADLLVIEGLTLLKILNSPGVYFGLARKGDDLDPKLEWMFDLMYYLTTRWILEQTAFSTVKGMNKEAMNLFDYMPAGISGFTKLMYLIGLGIATGIDKIGGPDLSNRKLYYDRNKEGSYKKGDSKFKTQFLHIAPYIRSYYVLDNLKQAPQNFEYGRRIRGK